MEIIILGNPIAKRRPRFFRRGNFVGTYNSQETEEGKWMLEAKGQIHEILEGPVALSASFFMPIPKSKKIKPDSMGIYPPHIIKSDLDNLLKFVLDCLNGLAFKDDSQVCLIKAQKRYSPNPKTIIRIEKTS